MKPTVKFDFSGLDKKLNSVSKVLDADELVTDIGNTAIKRIKGVTRTGKEIESGSSQPALSQESKDSRKQLAKRNRTHSTFSPGRSNLTFTGQLLDSLTFKKIRGGVRIEPSGSRKPYKGGSKKVLTNKQVAGLLAKMKPKRVFLGVDNEMVKQIKSIIKRFLRRKLRR